jgi:hypothetical protein
MIRLLFAGDWHSRAQHIWWQETHYSRQMLAGCVCEKVIPGEIRSHCGFKLSNSGVEYGLPRTSHCGVREEHIESAIQANGFFDNIFYTCFICRVKLFRCTFTLG